MWHHFWFQACGTTSGFKDGGDLIQALFPSQFHESVNVGQAGTADVAGPDPQAPVASELLDPPKRRAAEPAAITQRHQVMSGDWVLFQHRLSDQV
jgi:hypothetical protein